MPKTILEIENSDFEDELVLCAGLQYEGTRSLSNAERDALLVRLRNQRRTTVLWLLGIPACLSTPFIVWTLVDLTAIEPAVIETTIFIAAIVLVLIGIPASIYCADVAFKRYRVVRRTWVADHVRHFAGKLSSDDWTSNTDLILRKAACLEGDENPDLSIDLHASDDVLYTINDRATDQWIALELTRGVRPPAAPARFTAPIVWLDPEREDDIFRRRLLPGELDEILGYAAQMRRQRWWKLLTAAWIVAVLSRLAGLKIFEFAFTEIFALWAVVTAIVCGGLSYYWTSKAELYDKDREDGWAIILEPAQVYTLSDGERTSANSIEVLPISGSTWTIGGKPAGWRNRI